MKHFILNSTIVHEDIVGASGNAVRVSPQRSSHSMRLFLSVFYWK